MNAAKQSIFRWFDLDDDNERRQYEAIWRSCSVRRPHDHPATLELMQPKGNRSAVIVYRHSDLSTVIYPFYYADLNQMPAFAGCAQGIHVTSPYGYGGPVFEGPQEERADAEQRFTQFFREELARRHAVSEFVREDLFREQLVCRSDGSLLEQQKNVVVRLNRTPDEIWTQYKHKVRKNVNKAKSFNLEVVFDDNGKYLDDFVAIYHETMRRSHAKQGFFITKESFTHLIETLGQDDGLMFVHVFRDGTMVSTELLLKSLTTIYSFLGGTLENVFDMRPNDLLKHETILWGNKNGYSHYVLGGGVYPDDGIFKYKESFDPDGIMPFYVRKVIHQEEVYNDLIQQRMVFEKSHHREWMPSEDYFPGYLS